MTPKLNVFAIIVEDMPKALEFYRKIGLEIPRSADSEPHVEVQLGSGLRLAFDAVETVKSFMPDWTPSTGSWGSLAFECDSPAEVDRIFGELTEAGYKAKMKPWDAFWGQRYAVVRDPDSNTVDFYAALP